MGIDFPYTVIRKPRRRSVTLSISPRNHLTLTVPQNFSESRIQEFLARQTAWIEKKIRRNQELCVQYPLKTYQSGDLFNFLGQPYRLEIIEADQRSIRVEEDRLQLAAPRAEIQGVGGEGENVASMIRAWYEGMAHQTFKERVAVYEQKMNLKAGPLHIRTLRSQWGSCRLSGDLNFNARLMMAPLEIVDYVVVHELSHLIHHNHSERFWKQVEKILPDYRRRRKWLREHGNFLTL